MGDDNYIPAFYGADDKYNISSTFTTLTVDNGVMFLLFQWMYIVPVVIFVVLSGASNPDGGAAGGGGGAAR
jgi:hypothetical protein